jgi:hypothetical protein
MNVNLSHRIFKIGLFILALAYFSYALYALPISITSIIAYYCIYATIGIGFRTAGGLIAVITCLLYLSKKDLSLHDAIMSLRWVVLFEAIYFLSLLPAGYWGLVTSTGQYPRALLITSTGIPCLVEGIVIPVVLVKLFWELNPNKPVKNTIKWGLISGTAYIFVYWLNYSLIWIAALIQKGIDLVILYPINLFGFAITVGGLFMLALFAANLAKRETEKECLTALNLKKVGLIVTAFGLYFDLTYLIGLLLGSVGGVNIWYTFLIHNNVDLWMLLLPLVGIPLLFGKIRQFSEP